MPFIEGLDPSTPDPNDVAGITDDELRNLKLVLQDQFAGEAGDLYDIPITVGPRSLNLVNDKANQTDLDATDANVATNTTQIGLNTSAIVDHEARISAIEADYTTGQQAIAAAWPVGSVFVAIDGVNPSSKGFPGTWAAVGDGRMLLGAAVGFGNEEGTDQLTLSVNELPPHKHTHALPSKNGDNTNNTPFTDEYYQNPGRFNTQSRVGADGNTSGWSTQNTSDGQDGSPALAGDPITLPTPPHVVVRFYQRTA